MLFLKSKTKLWHFGWAILPHCPPEDFEVDPASLFEEQKCRKHGGKHGENASDETFGGREITVLYMTEQGNHLPQEGQNLKGNLWPLLIAQMLLKFLQT